MDRHWSLPVVCMSVLLAAGSAPAAEQRGVKHVRSLAEIRNAQVVRQHWDLSCGAAAIATLLTYQLGDPVSEHDVAVALLHHTNPVKVRQRLGFSLLDLKNYAESRGHVAAGYGGLSLDELVGVAPAIAPVKINGYDHFVVVRGKAGDRLLLADPAFGNRTMPAAAFVAAWKGGIAFVVHNSDGGPKENHLGPAVGLPDRPGDAAIRAGELSSRLAVRPR